MHYRSLARTIPGIVLAFAMSWGSSSLYATPLLVSSSDLTPRGCIVTDSEEVVGCKKGDQIIYLPSRWGNEQMPLVVAAFCDLRLSVVWTKGGLTCIYAGPRQTVKAHDEIVAKKYRPLYDAVKANSDGWVEIEDNEFWRVTTQGTGKDIVPGVTIRVERSRCEHNLEGEESSRTDFETASEGIKIEEGDFIVQFHAKDGATIEVVTPTEHNFLRCWIK